MKILISYAYAGIGHKKAALAVEDALSGFSGLEVSNVDMLDYTDTFFKFSYPRVYLFLINRVPLLWGLLYYLLDLKLVDRFLAPVRRFFHGIHTGDFVRFVIKERPDVVVCTHFLPAEVVSGLKRKGIFKGRLITIVTDFMPHAFWMAMDSDYFIAGIEGTKKELMRRGIEGDRIKVFGIPCESKFSVSKSREGLLKKLGLEGGFFNLLVMSGGFGTGPVREIVYSFDSEGEGIRKAIQLIVICGRNKGLHEELSAARASLKCRLNIFGYMDNIDEFMEVSDCIITKSGGLTVSEALSKRLPMIIIRPIPGQETRNCKVLTGYGAAVRADSIKDVLLHVRDFIDYPEKIIGIKKRAGLFSYPDAARDIARFVLSSA